MFPSGPSSDLLSSYHRITKSSSSRSRQDVLPNKPSGLTGLTKAAIIYPAASTVDEDDGPSTLTDDEEITDDLEFSAGSKDSLVSPPTPLHILY